jgi:hypothetical protein
LLSAVTCQNQTRQINSFYAQLNADQVVATPATSLLALNNISMSISCLPALQNCGIPSGMMGTEQYLWTSVLGLSSFQQGSNVSDYVNQTMIDIFPALAQSIPSAAPLPEFVQNNSMGKRRQTFISLLRWPTSFFSCLFSLRFTPWRTEPDVADSVIPVRERQRPPV